MTVHLRPFLSPLANRSSRAAQILARQFTVFAAQQQQFVPSWSHEGTVSEQIFGKYRSRAATNRPRRLNGGPSPFPPTPQAPPSQHSESATPSYPNGVLVKLGNTEHDLSPIQLRDSCTCDKCVDVSTKQKLFSTVDIPTDIRADVSAAEDGVKLRWTNDIDSYGPDHETLVPRAALQSIVEHGSVVPAFQPPRRVLWDDKRFRTDVEDISYDSYMQDDAVLYKAVNQLHTHGLIFVTEVPEAESSVSTIAERIGPLKNSFYGTTWDVRSVPQAKNVAYTSQDLGFHMDLLYMKQPPHLQLLHCIRSSSLGGASLFTDSFRAALDLYDRDIEAFLALTSLQVDFHYNHPESHYYRQSRTLIELRRLKLSENHFSKMASMLRFTKTKSVHKVDPKHLYIPDWIDAISWAPPFQAPFSMISTADKEEAVVKPVKSERTMPPEQLLGNRVTHWHAAARHFNRMIHRPEGIYERMMKPGECVIFDNRRVLHARRAFEVGDAGKERWLRGAYLDKDPYMSKMRVLHNRFGGA